MPASDVYSISIPYGSIKSHIPSKPYKSDDKISIPYGSIKRIPKWQPNPLYWQISIPYGSIKSTNKGIACLHSISFQFLMVQLKAGRAGISPRRWGISIPYGSIKRRAKSSKATARKLYFNSLWFN